MKVSIPDRYAKNSSVFRDIFIFFFVSIPDRYAKNPLGITLTPQLLQFQFLIGTLKTTGRRVTRIGFIRQFQFLIGTLKTLLSILVGTAWSVFQFLIGTLKTVAKSQLLCNISSVSIPDRYAKNDVMKIS